jgi:hypothetical protein
MIRKRSLFNLVTLACLALFTACSSNSSGGGDPEPSYVAFLFTIPTPSPSYLYWAPLGVTGEEQLASTKASLNGKPIPSDAQWTFNTTVNGRETSVPFTPTGYNSEADTYDWTFTPQVPGKYAVTAKVTIGQQLVMDFLPLEFFICGADAPIYADIHVQSNVLVGSECQVMIESGIDTGGFGHSSIPPPPKGEWVISATKEGEVIDIPFTLCTIRIGIGSGTEMGYKFTPPAAGTYSVTATVKFGPMSVTTAPRVFTATDD